MLAFLQSIDVGSMPIGAVNPIRLGLEMLVTKLFRKGLTVANNLFISYDLMAPGQNYDRVIEAIKKLGDWAKVHYSLYYVKTTLTCQQAAEQVRRSMDADDKLIVIDAKDAYWYNTSTEASAYMQSNWSR